MVFSEQGILFKRKKTVSLEPPVSASCHYSPLARIFRYGALIIRDKREKSVTITHVPDPESYCQKIGNSSADLGQEDFLDIDYLLTKREHEKLEFKSSLRWDFKEKKVNKNLEKTILKTVAAFLNSEGGHLAVGIDDGGQAIGLEPDYATLNKRDADGFENHFTNIFKTAISPEFRNFIKLSFHKIEDKEICLIKVLPAPKPAYLKFDNEEYFYVRTGNATNALPLSQVTSYIQTRWKEF